VKYLGLVLANLGRHKLRTVLTIASVALALFLFASLRSVTTTLAATSATTATCGIPRAGMARIRRRTGRDGSTNSAGSPRVLSSNSTTPGAVQRDRVWGTVWRCARRS